jgi:hypothetical protein
MLCLRLCCVTPYKSLFLHIILPKSTLEQAEDLKITHIILHSTIPLKGNNLHAKPGIFYTTNYFPFLNFCYIWYIYILPFVIMTLYM